jgi:hypothetical protein
MISDESEGKMNKQINEQEVRGSKRLALMIVDNQMNIMKPNL